MRLGRGIVCNKKILSRALEKIVVYNMVSIVALYTVAYRKQFPNVGASHRSIYMHSAA